MLYIIKIAQSMSLFGLNIIDQTLPTFSHNTSIDEMFICIQTAGGYYKADLAGTWCQMYANKFLYVQILTYDPGLDIGWKIRGQKRFFISFYLKGKTYS